MNRIELCRPQVWCFLLSSGTWVFLPETLRYRSSSAWDHWAPLGVSYSRPPATRLPPTRLFAFLLDTRQYSTWNRTRSIHAAPYLARTDSTTSRAATAMSNLRQDAVLVNMTNVQDNETAPKDPTGPSKKHDTLFGPNIGIVSSGPEWTETSRDKSVVDELTPEIVKGWVAKSKEVRPQLVLLTCPTPGIDGLYQTSQPTTTLQALVNLKRPSLRLSPLTPSAADDSNADQPLNAHGLEFEYDCDAPKCSIRVYVVLSQGNQPAKDSTSGGGSTKVSVFDTVVDGGFSQMLKLEHGAVLELDRFDGVHRIDRPSPIPEAKPEEKETTTQTDNTPAAKKKRFTAFISRRHQREQSVSGPALAVVDSEVPVSHDSNTQENKEGLKVIIKLAALDENGHGFSSANEQLTYLHVARAGAVPPEGEEDKRPWVVHVVKREATVSHPDYLSAYDPHSLLDRTPYLPPP